MKLLEFPLEISRSILLISRWERCGRTYFSRTKSEDFVFATEPERRRRSSLGARRCIELLPEADQQFLQRVVGGFFSGVEDSVAVGAQTTIEQLRGEAGVWNIGLRKSEGRNVGIDG